ncbi:TetR/AcrR family transcriptional regulator [Peredibacter sp. HCB2-198]|uniref:TetR/AcrR family transcriptional regulator n=1 Tax=Peredibacter sp. HCB2-198 TaxID=3383025 RepID=UPI0038B5197D
MAKKTTINIEERKKDILDAALHCFLNFGYAKTSMDDVAKKAGISRPLIYLKFKNKEDLLLGLFDYVMEGRLEEAEKVAAQKDLSKKEKLWKMLEIIKVEPWGKISGCPMSQEFFNTCCDMDEKNFEKFEKTKHKILTDILGDKFEAEVFMMASDGLLEDVPNCTVLKKRLEVLIDKFGK